MQSLIADGSASVFNRTVGGGNPGKGRIMRKVTAGEGLRDMAVAVVLLSRLPMPALPRAAFADQARAAWAFPLVGLAIALPACALGWAALAVGLGAAAAAGLVLAAQVALTGAMHEDGLADTADGFWGGFDRARRLEIMRDSRIGAYGVIALVLGLGLRWTALAALLQAGAWGAVIAAACLSRSALPVLMAALPPARTDGLSQAVGRVRPGIAGGAVVLALALALALTGLPAMTAAVATGLALCGLAALARAKIGGQTGDVLGAAQQLAEIAALLAYQALLTA